MDMMGVQGRRRNPIYPVVILSGFEVSSVSKTIELFPIPLGESPFGCHSERPKGVKNLG